MFLTLLFHHQGVHSYIKQYCEHKHAGCSNCFAHICLYKSYTHDLQHIGDEGVTIFYAAVHSLMMGQ